MTPGLTRGIKKGLRTVAQVAAGGALTALVTAVVGGLAPTTQAIVMGAWIAFVAFSQNWAEGAGKMPVLLPTPALITGPAASTVATVEGTADQAGEIVGEVLDTAGDVVGAVTGQLDDSDGEAGSAGMIALLVVIFFVVLAVGGFAVCDLMFDDESEPGDNHLLGRVELVSHDYDDGSCYGYECREGGSGNEGEYRDDNRRAGISPGPFDDSPVTIWICAVPDSCRRDNQPPNEGEPQ